MLVLQEILICVKSGSKIFGFGYLARADLKKGTTKLETVGLNF